MRYAVYYAPHPLHPLWHAGCDWLGRNPLADEARAPMRAHVDQPWRYGFHATLKPPMRLAEGRDAAGLHAALADLAAGTPRFEMPALSVQWLSGFIALRPRDPLPPSHPLQSLADACVTELDVWRANLSPDELKRRRPETLAADQRNLIHRYGYAHVLTHWRFHMTLTDSLPHDTSLRDDLLQAAHEHFAAALEQPLACDALSLFVEPAPGQPFRLVRRFELA